MKHSLLIILPLLLLHPAAAQDSRTLDRADLGRQFAPVPGRDWDRAGGWSRLRWAADRLNAMADHVRYRMRRYGAGPLQWNRFSRVQSDISRINYKVRNRTGDRDRVSRDIQNARDALHRIELQLRFRSRDYYRWP